MSKLLQEEKILSVLSELYERRGFIKYKPSCFEDYASYLEYSDFCSDKNVLTFRAADGRLLALRPDVTMSLVKHSPYDGGQTEKLYYTEKVYRRSKTGGDFKEVNQAGVEVIGEIDGVCVAEAVCLAFGTLSTLSENYYLDISHTGFADEVVSSFGLDENATSKALNYLKSKNAHDFCKLCDEAGLDNGVKAKFESLVKIDGNLKKAIKEAEKLSVSAKSDAALEDLKQISYFAEELGLSDAINLNFSISNNAEYYDGIIFNGYVAGVPYSVLSGGRYDKLLKRLNKSGGAIGFALYLDEFERYFKTGKTNADCLIVYDDETQLKALKLAEKLAKEGKSARLSRTVTENFAEIYNLTEGKND